MKKQKFHNGDHVKVADDLGPTMSHFTAGVEAIVIGSYKDQYGGDNTNDYTLHLKGGGLCAWYRESQLTLIAEGQHDMLKQWEDERDAEIAQKSELDWIFDNGQEVLQRPHRASVQALANCVGIGDLWGSHGEGLAYYENTRRVLAAAAPYLEARDKDGWLEFAKAHQMTTVDYQIS